MKRKSESRQERKMIVGAIVMLIISAVLFGLATEPGINLINKVKEAIMPKMSITISAANNETLRNKITETKIEGGYNHFIALGADGKVYGWGYNGYGQLGINNTTNCKEPTYLGIDNVIDIAAGGNFTVVLKKDGTVWATGYNEYGQLGQNNTTNQKIFVQVMDEQGTGKLSNIKAIEAGGNTTYAITNNGEVYSWGYNTYGQIGIGNTTTQLKPVKTSLESIKQISANQYHAVALTENGEVYVSGYNAEGELGIGNNQNSVEKWQKMRNPSNTDDMKNVKQVATGRYHTMVLTNDEKVYATGYNNTKQLADGTTTTRNLLKPMKDSTDKEITNVKTIEAAGYSSYIITNNNELYSAGYNNYGQQFQNNTTDVAKLTKIKTEIGIERIAATKMQDKQTAAYIDKLGRIYTVGYNGNGELGNTLIGSSNIPYSISDSKIVADEPLVNISQGTTNSINPKYSTGFTLINNEIKINLKYESLDTNIATVSGNKIAGVGIGTTHIKISDETNKIYGSVKVNVNVQGGIAQPKVVGGENHFVALKSDGTVWTWGYNGNGQLGLGDTTNRTEPTKVDIENVIDITAGNQYTAILKKDRTVWTTGYSGYGTSGISTEKTNQFKQVPNITDVIEISSEANTMHALKKDGTIWSWGLNDYGNFGNSTTSGSATIEPYKMVRIPSIMQMSSGKSHIAMVSAEGTVWVTGRNDEGQLGLGDKTGRTTPQQIINTTGTDIAREIKEVSCGEYCTLVVTNNGEAYSTGYNNYGVLATGNTTDANKLTPMLEEETNAPIKNVKTIKAGGYLTIAIKNDGKGIYVTGYSNYAQDFTTNTTTKTKLVKTQEDKQILSAGMTKSTSVQTSAIIDQTGKIWTVGYNGYGQIGNGTTESLKKAWCIQNNQIDVSKNNTINLQTKGDQKQIQYTEKLGFNILTNNQLIPKVTFRTLDNKIATVSSTGIITAQELGTTYIEIKDEEKDITARVKVNVNGEGNETLAKIEGGYNHFITLKGDGTVWGYGINTNGELGVGDETNRIKPTQAIAEIELSDGSKKDEKIEDAIDIAAGGNFSVILRRDGTVWTSGYNDKGQLGNGTTNKEKKFHKVKLNANGEYLENIIQVTAGGHTTYALTANGKVYSWGYNYYGEFGNKTTSETNPYPVKMQKISNIIQISGGESNLIMLESNGSIWATGRNDNGQLGQNNLTHNILPQQMVDANGNEIKEIKEISAGAYHTIALKEDNTVYTTGYNNCGQQGDGTTTDKKVLTPITDEEGNIIKDAKHIKAASDSTIITRQKDSNGKNQGMYVIGYNANGQLFTKDQNSKNRITKVETDKDIIAVAVTRSRSASTGAIADQDGMVYTVGYNGHGEMGCEFIQHLTTPWCISKKKINVDNKIITLQQVGEQKQITINKTLEYNLIRKDVPNSKNTYKSMDTKIATVDENTGKVTATGIGTTYIKIKDENNNLTTAIKVNVTGEGNLTFAKIVGGYRPYRAS